MKQIKEEIINEIIINKSKFITVLTAVYDKKEIDEKINYYKKNYKNATHYCYGYILNGTEKCSDDGEPSGTAGVPILNVLKNNDLNYILCIVIRYFGGIKLGAGGLVRAYSNSVTKTLEKTSVTELIKGYKIEIEFDYENTKAIDNLLKNYKINKKYEDKTIYEFKISEDKFNNIKNILESKSKILKKESILLAV